MKIKQFGEFNMIQRFLKKFETNRPELELPPGDDCAVISAGTNKSVLVTTDLLVENVHFRKSTIHPGLLGRKSIAVNLSDIAAMGARPTFCFLSLACPPDYSLNFLDQMAEGMAEICAEYQVCLAGGDTTSSPENLVINICMLGEAMNGAWVTRSGAQPGDIIQVSGNLGQSMAGFELLEQSCDGREFKRLINAHLDPVPRIEVGMKLAGLGIHSMIDISDGLFQDLGHICQQSNVGAHIDFDKIPISDDLLRYHCNDHLKAGKSALSGGEDYELCWTVCPSKADESLNLARAAGAANACSIGEIVPKVGIRIFRDSVELNVSTQGWDHFTEEDHP